jgi:hypothetical protein
VPAKLIRPLAIALVSPIPALALRLSGIHPPGPLGLLVFGTAVVASSFLLAWAAEAARVDISGPLAIALLAVVAVLPEYAVDLYFAYTIPPTSANMTGSNRLAAGPGLVGRGGNRAGRGVAALRAYGERTSPGIQAPRRVGLSRDRVGRRVRHPADRSDQPAAGFRAARLLRVLPVEGRHQSAR